MDAATLQRALDAAALPEYAQGLSERLDELNVLGHGAIDKKALLALLKDAGCSKMGTRQKLAAVLTCELMSASKPPPPPPADDACGAAFWGQMIQDAALSTAFDDLPPPTSAAADRALLSSPKAPPVAAAVARPPKAFPPSVAATSPSTSKAAVETGSATPIAMPTSPPPPPPPPPDAPPSPAAQQADLFRKLGDEAYSRKDIPTAERWFVQALATTPKSVALLSRLANCALNATPPQPRQALSHLQALLDLPPPHADARLWASKCCLEVGQGHALAPPSCLRAHL